MEFRKKIEIPPSELKISHRSKMVLFGSCFAENMGKQLAENNFPVNINPFGVLYNPASIAKGIDILLTEKEFGEEDVFFHQDLYHSFSHHSSFSNPDLKVFLKKINETRRKSTNDLLKANILLITFGTSYVFEYKETMQVVGNCHKLPASSFQRHRLSIEEIVTPWDKLISKLRASNPSLKFLFTVSPIRHWKDGAHGNQLSKAILLLAIEELSLKHSDVFYFPSYEIVLDELRDYRFYAEDMIHPNNIAINYIWKVFANTYFDKETMDINAQWQNISRAIKHRPFNPNTDQHKQFLMQTLLKVRDIRNKYAYFDCEKEELLLMDKLSAINLR